MGKQQYRIIRQERLRPYPKSVVVPPRGQILPGDPDPDPVVRFLDRLAQLPQKTQLATGVLALEMVAPVWRAWAESADGEVILSEALGHYNPDLISEIIELMKNHVADQEMHPGSSPLYDEALLAQMATDYTDLPNQFPGVSQAAANSVLRAANALINASRNGGIIRTEILGAVVAHAAHAAAQERLTSFHTENRLHELSKKFISRWWSEVRRRFPITDITSADIEFPSRTTGGPQGWEWDASDKPTSASLQRLIGDKNWVDRIRELGPLYHGTSYDAATEIEQNGVLKSQQEWGSGRKGIFVWTDLESALNWANYWYGDDGAVIQIDPSYLEEVYMDWDPGNSLWKAYRDTRPSWSRKNPRTIFWDKFSYSMLIPHDVPFEGLSISKGYEFVDQVEDWRYRQEHWEEKLDFFTPVEWQFIEHDPEGPGWARRIDT